jgi:hypothetical protein
MAPDTVLQSGFYGDRLGKLQPADLITALEQRWDGEKVSA